MKKVIATFTIFVLVSGISFSVEAAIFSRFKQKVADKIKGRQNDDVSNKLSEIATKLTSLGTSLTSSGASQKEYIDSQYLLEEEDLSFLDAYSDFAQISGDFFANFGSKIKKLRMEYAALLGAQNRSNQVSTETEAANSNQSSTELKINSKTANIQNILATLTSDGFNANHTTLQCLAIILLKIMQKHPLPEANRPALQEQIAAIHQKYGPFLSLLSEDIVNNINGIKAKIGSQKENMEPFVKTITIVYHTINILRRYVNVSHDDKLIEEINRVLNQSPYYNPVKNGGNNASYINKASDAWPTVDDDDYDDDATLYGGDEYDRDYNNNYDDSATLYDEDEYDDDY